MITFKVLFQCHKIQQLIAKEFPSWSPEGLLLPPKHSFPDFQTRKVFTFLETSLCKKPTRTVSEGKISHGLPNPTKGSSVLKSPREETGGLHGRRSSTERIRVSGCEASRYPPSCYQKERKARTLSRPGRRRYMASPVNADPTFGRVKLMGTQHAHQNS